MKLRFAEGIALAALLSGSAFAAEALPAPLRLVEPAAEARLVGGSLAVLEVAVEPGAPAPREWEAFLSFDDGDTFPVRLTAHLPISTRRVAFRVPGGFSGNARILLRCGDERDEVESPLVPIRLDTHPAILEPLPETSFGGGERAREGLAETVLFSEASAGRPPTLRSRAAGDTSLRLGTSHPAFRRLLAKLRIRRDFRIGGALPTLRPLDHASVPETALASSEARADSEGLLVRIRRRNV